MNAQTVTLQRIFFHLIYLCEIGRNIWQFAEIILNFDITWKLILCGFFNEINENT